MFVIYFFFLFSLSSIGEGAVIVAGFGSRRSREILVGRLSFLCWRMSGERERGEVFGACRRKEKGGQKKERSVYLLVPGYSLTPPYS